MFECCAIMRFCKSRNTKLEMIVSSQELNETLNCKGENEENLNCTYLLLQDENGFEAFEQMCEICSGVESRDIAKSVA